MEYSQIDASGPDATEFLQGQLSHDLRLLEDRPVLLAAWCNPKGRVITLLHVARSGDGYALAMPADIADAVIRRLDMFRFRAKVDFDPAPIEPYVLGLASSDPASIEDWRTENLHRGIPEISAVQSEVFTPHMLNLDKLDAISFDKGCYPGQEIVARTHYRGASRRRMLRFASTGAIAAGDEVYAGERKVGDVVNAIGRELLAVVPLDSADANLSAAGNVLSALPLPYDLS